jgi:hypothetical protein
MGTEPRDEYAYTGLHAYAHVHDVTATTQDPDRNAFSFPATPGHGRAARPVTARWAGRTFKGSRSSPFGDDGDVNALQGPSPRPSDGVTYELAYGGRSMVLGLIGLKRRLRYRRIRPAGGEGTQREVLGRPETNSATGSAVRRRVRRM